MLKLNSIQEINSGENKFTCDALTVLRDFMNVADIKAKQKHILFLKENILKSIQPNETYLYIEVFDDESGEVLEMKCIKSIHQYNLTNKLYPFVLIKMFTNYDRL